MLSRVTDALAIDDLIRELAPDWHARAEHTRGAQKAQRNPQFTAVGQAAGRAPEGRLGGGGGVPAARGHANSPRIARPDPPAVSVEVRDPMIRDAMPRLAGGWTSPRTRHPPGGASGSGARGSS